MKNQFSSTIALYGQNNFNKFSKVKVAIVGVGGIGSNVAIALARTGFFNLTLIDLDDVCTTNINRQMQAFHSTVGSSKVEALKKQILDINPSCNVQEIVDFILCENVQDYIFDFNIVIDCIDNVKSKVCLISHCLQNKIKILVSGAAGGKFCPSFVRSGDLVGVFNDKLLAKVRYQLRKIHPIFKGYKDFQVECVFSIEQIKINKNRDSENLAVCDYLYGSSFVMVSTIANYLANKTINFIISH